MRMFIYGNDQSPQTVLLVMGSISNQIWYTLNPLFVSEVLVAGSAWQIQDTVIYHRRNRALLRETYM